LSKLTLAMAVFVEDHGPHQPRKLEASRKLPLDRETIIRPQTPRKALVTVFRDRAYPEICLTSQRLSRDESDGVITDSAGFVVLEATAEWFIYSLTADGGPKRRFPPATGSDF